MLQAFEHSEELKSQGTDCFGHLVRTDELKMMFTYEIAPAGLAFRTVMIRRVTGEAWDPLEMTTMMDEQCHIRSRGVCHQLDLVRT